MFAALRNLTSMASATGAQAMSSTKEELTQALRDRWETRKEALEAIGGDGGSGGSSDLGRHIPEVDSKEVAMLRPIFESHLDADFDPKLVQPGGYDSIDSAIEDLVPPHIERHEAMQE